ILYRAHRYLPSFPTRRSSDLVLFAEAVLGIGFQMQEVGADRPVAVLETGENDSVLHLRHLGAGADQQAVGRARRPRRVPDAARRSEEHTSELQSRENLVCRLL